MASLIAAGPAVAHGGGTDEGDDGNEGSEDRNGNEGEGSEGNSEVEEDEEGEEGAAGGGRTSGTKRKRKAQPSSVRLRSRRPHALLRRPDGASSDNRCKLSTYLQAPLELDDVVILIAARAISAGEELSFDYCRASLPAPANGPSGGGVGGGVGGSVGGSVGGGVGGGIAGSDVGGSNSAYAGAPRGGPSDGPPALAHRDKGRRLQQCRCGSASCRLTF